MSTMKKLKLTTRGRYAVMAMVELAERGKDRPIPLAEVAKSGNISLSYLEQLFAGLRRNGLVKSYRGPGGGYVLAQDAEHIKISDILISAEDCVPAKRAVNENHLNENKQTTELWNHIGEILFVCLNQLTLHDVASGKLSDHPSTNKLFETFG